MNKFLKHKVKQIQQLNDSLIVGFTPQSVSDYYLNFLNNRNLNERLRALRQLPKELLVSNNPEIAEAIAARDALLNLNWHTKLAEGSPTILLENLRKQQAQRTTEEPVEATNQLLKQQLELRKQKKAEYLIAANKVEKLIQARVKELVNTNPKVAKQLRKFLLTKAKLSPTLTLSFTEDTNQPIRQFINEWISRIDSGV